MHVYILLHINGNALTYIHTHVLYAATYIHTHKHIYTVCVQHTVNKSAYLAFMCYILMYLTNYLTGLLIIRQLLFQRWKPIYSF